MVDRGQRVASDLVEADREADAAPAAHSGTAADGEDGGLVEGLDGGVAGLHIGMVEV